MLGLGCLLGLSSEPLSQNNFGLDPSCAIFNNMNMNMFLTSLTLLLLISKMKLHLTLQNFCKNQKTFYVDNVCNCV